MRFRKIGKECDKKLLKTNYLPLSPVAIRLRRVQIPQQGREDEAEPTFHNTSSEIWMQNSIHHNFH